MSRTVMLLAAAGNLLLAIGIYVLGHGGWGIASTVSISKFHDLTFHHAVQIDTEALKRATDGRVSDEYGVPPFLNEGFRDDLSFVNVAALALILDALILAYAGWRVPRTAEKTEPRHTQ